MDVYEAAAARRSIRRFEDRPVPYAALEKCVEAARLAPSGRNQQVLEYIIIDDERGRAGVFDNITSWAGQPAAKGAPPPEHRPQAYFLILINKGMEDEFHPNRRAITLLDAGMAAENIMLTAREQGIGTCAILMFREDALKKLLGVPDNHDIALLIIAGYPAESPVAEDLTESVALRMDGRGVRHVPKRKLADICHRNRF
jgi:nitroreductase